MSETRSSNFKVIRWSLLCAAFSFSLIGCNHQEKVAAAPAQAMPVKVAAVDLSPVPASDTYVSTIKGRRSATMQPQVDGNLTRILVKSGDVVKAGQLLMQIDPLKQAATVQSQQGTQAQKKALYDYNKIQLERQRKLYEAGVVSRDAFDQATQAYENSKADYEANSALTSTQQQQLAYYQIRAPFSGVVGDIPVHVGDYVSPTTLLTTVDENIDLEAYIYIPTERAAQIRTGLPVNIIDADGTSLVKTSINFLSPQVDNGLQSILAKAPIPRGTKGLRTQQLVKARVTWNSKPAPVIPVLAVTRIGGQTFVFVAAPKDGGYSAHQIPVTLGEPIGNTYPVLEGLQAGDKVIVSGLQFLQEGVPVQPMG
ncbi:efflux RND transporter periplasmic adaptor subunit [Edaphobacter albus]|uniref:efflux RND transporter periplasmic adaptor subunit n=1 Tax=Edaphobacter sp. 4G125 TaxID=2763071 RepID=UPI002105200B|nr:efflux RND transporter periplasmic adaptor subunit [Edaphobacter sp. 4G125]